MSILGLPVATDPPRDEPQHMTGEMRNLHSRQYQKAGVVGEPLQVAFARWAVPLEEGVAVRALPCREAEQRTSHRSPVPVADQIAEVLAHCVSVAKVVVICQQTVEHPEIFRAWCNVLHRQGTQVAEAPANRFACMIQHRYTAVAELVGGGSLPCGQLDETTPLQLEQQRACRHVLDTPLIVAPVPDAAQFFAEPRPAPVPMFRHQIADHTDLIDRDVPSLNDHALCHGQHERKSRPTSSAENEFVFLVRS